MMRNIFLLPTDKPSKLLINASNVLVLGKDVYTITVGKQHIYITNDEKPQKGDYVYNSKLNLIRKFFLEANGVNSLQREDKKIILTNDPDLNGVQSISDEFLEWFVKHPTCEYVEVEEKTVDEIEKELGIYGHDIGLTEGEKEDWLKDGGQLYKIIIPKEEEFCHYSGLPSPAAYITKPKEKEGDSWLSPMQRFKLREDKPLQVQGGEDIKFPSPTVIIVGSGMPPPKLTLELTQKEARGLMNCIMRTHAKGTDLDVGEAIEEKLWEFLKPLEKK